MKKRIKALLKEKNYLLILGIFLVIALINTFHFFYQDEFENILGGFYITEGRLPYSGFFTHHAPFAYILASLISFFTKASFVKFRIVLSILFFSLICAFFIFIRKKIGKSESHIFLIFAALVLIGGTYFWGHMLLADSLVGYLLLPAYILLIFRSIKNIKLDKNDLIIISTLTALTLFTSLTFIYACSILYIYLIYYFYSTNKYKVNYKTALRLLLILVFPYFLFLTYFLITRTLNDFYYQAIYFNKEYYIVMPNGGPVHNPLRYAVVILANFIDKYHALIISIKDLNLGQPFNTSLALGNMLFFIYLMINKRFKIAILQVGLLIFLNARSDPLSSQETDYQAIPYDYFSIFNGIFLLSQLWNELKRNIAANKKIIYQSFLLILGVFYIFLFIFLFNKSFEKAYGKYMGTQPLIYDRPVIANVLNGLLSKDDYYYIGPFVFEEHLYMKSKLASKYLITIPAMDKSEKIKKELMDDLQKNRPKIVVFNTDDRIFGTFPGKYVVDFLKSDYFNIDQLNRDGANIKVRYNSFGPYDRYDFKRHFFFDKKRKDEILKLLYDQKLIGNP